MPAATVLRRYRELTTLGSGGTATVTLARDTMLGRLVALKRVHAAGEPHALSRLRREALVGASLNHPNLVAIYDVESTEDEDLVIVMEFVDGETLRDLLRRGPIAERQALGVLDGAAAALDAIHARGIVHRDVKPANILLAVDGAIKLADLGIAAAADRTRLTSAGIVVGTYSYMAPEQLEGEESSAAMDIYALAAVAFETLSGRRAHTESNPIALAHALATAEPPDLRDAWPQAPAAAADVLRRGMAFDPSERPRSATELVGRLRAGLASQPTESVSPGRPRLPVPPRQPPSRATAPATHAPWVGARRPRSARPPGVLRRAPREEGGAGTPRRSLAASRLQRRLALAGIGAIALLAGSVAAATLSSGGGTHGSPPAASSRHTTGARSTAGARSAGPSPTRAAATGSSAAPSSTTPPAATPPANRPPAGTAPASTPPAGAAPSGAAAPAPTGSAASGGAASPESAVQTFYQLAAAHRFADAWRLADHRFQRQLEGFGAFSRQQSAVRSISFDRLAIIRRGPSSATVEVATTPVLDSGTQHCHGTVTTVSGGGGGSWLLDQIAIQC